MAKRWFIHKDDKPTGPYAAAEIRQLLRDGAVDPFDLVSVEGSPVKQELVEVDEIFQSDNVAYQDKAAGAEGGAFSPQIRERSYSNKEKRVANGSTLAPGSHNPPGQMIALASDMRKIGNSNNPVRIKNEKSKPAPAPSRKKRDPKKYHLIDAKGRVLGPLSPGEVQSLYYRGVVDKNVKVMRDGSTSKVAVGKFVMAYAEAQGMKSLPNQGAHPNIQGASKSALNRMALMRRARQMQQATGMSATMIGIIAAAVILVVLTIGLLVKNGVFSGIEEPETRERPRQEIQSRPVKRTPERRSPVRSTPKVKPKAKPQASQRPAARSGGALGRPVPKIRQAIKVVRSKRTPTRQVRPTYTRPKSPPKPLKQAYTPPRQVQPYTPPKQVRPYTPPKQVKAFGQQPVPVAKPKGLTIGSLVNGQSVSGLGPMSFSRDAVDICQGTCSVLFTGAGGTVSVAFFKNVWGPKLMAKSGGVYISGLVRKSGGSVKILLSGVR